MVRNYANSMPKVRCSHNIVSGLWQLQWSLEGSIIACHMANVMLIAAKFLSTILHQRLYFIFFGLHAMTDMLWVQFEDVCFGLVPSLQALSSYFPMADLLFDGGASVHLEPINYLYLHPLIEKAYCLGLFDYGQAGTLLGGIVFRDILVQVSLPVYPTFLPAVQHAVCLTFVRHYFCHVDRSIDRSID